MLLAIVLPLIAVDCNCLLSLSLSFPLSRSLSLCVTLCFSRLITIAAGVTEGHLEEKVQRMSMCSDTFAGPSRESYRLIEMHQ